MRNSERVRPAGVAGRLVQAGAAGLLLLVLAGCASTVSWGRYGNELNGLSAEAWIEDIDALERDLVRRHPEPFHSVEEEVFSARLAQLRSEAERIADGRARADAMVAGIHGALALLQEGHTTVDASPSIQYPALIRRFRTAEGEWEFRVAYSDEALPEIRGRRILAIGGLPPEQALERVAAYASAERDDGRVFFAQRLMADPRLMRGIGIADEDGLLLTVATPDGDVDVLLEPQPVESLSLWSPDLSVIELQKDLERSLSFRGSGRFWYEIAGSTLYFRYNSSTTDALSMMNEIIDLVEAGKVERLVIDLRFNGGGNSFPGTRFVNRLSATAVGIERGRLYVMISENTFSSAIMTAVDAMAETEAILVGTPLAAPVDSWGEVRRFALPNSGLVIGHSTRYWDYTSGKSLRLVDGVVRPDPGWEAAWTFDEWVAGYDPALELILAAERPK
ncbi:MAG: hypothetical protein ACLFNT_13270 [Spirochaetales bacterium]